MATHGTCSDAHPRPSRSGIVVAYGEALDQIIPGETPVFAQEKEEVFISSASVLPFL